MPGLTVRTDTPGLEHWRVQEDDYGDPVIFHRHVGTEHPAYIIDRAGDRQLAQCSSCEQYLELAGMTPAATTN